MQAALTLDPRYAAAHGYLAFAYEMRFMRGGFDPDDAASSLRHAQATLAHGGDDAAALAVAALPIFTIAGDFTTASGAIERALKQNSACAAALFNGALFHGTSGDRRIAEDYAGRALRLSPFDPLAFQADLALGHVGMREQSYERAVEHYRRCVQANPRFSPGFLFLTCALALAGRREAAAQAAATVLALQPNFSFGALMSALSRVMSVEFGIPTLARAAKEAGLPD